MPNQLLQEAINLIKAGDTVKAKARVFAVLKTEPENADAWYLAAYLLQGRDKQIQALERTLALDPNHQRAQIALAKLQATPPVENPEVTAAPITPPDLSAAPPPITRPVTPKVRSAPPRRSLVPLLIITILAVGLIGAAAVLVMNKLRSDNGVSDPVMTLTAIAQQADDAATAAFTQAAVVQNTAVVDLILVTPTVTVTSTPVDTATNVSSPTTVSQAISPLDLQKTAQSPTNTAALTAMPTTGSSATPTLTATSTTALTLEATQPATSAVITATQLKTLAVTLVSLSPSSTPVASATSVASETATTLPSTPPAITSTPTSAGTLTPGSQDDPIPAKQVYRFPGLGRLNILSTTWTSGQTGLAILKVSFICDRPASQHCDTSNFLFSAIGDSSASYDRAFVTGIPDPAFGGIQNANLPGGGRSTGYVGFQISNPEQKLVLHVNVFESKADVYFVIG